VRSLRIVRLLVLGIGLIVVFVNRVSAQPAAVDLSTYVRVGRFDLPEPTRTPAPANSLLAQEASGGLSTNTGSCSPQAPSRLGRTATSHSS